MPANTITRLTHAFDLARISSKQGCFVASGRGVYTSLHAGRQLFAPLLEPCQMIPLPSSPLEVLDVTTYMPYNPRVVSFIRNTARAMLLRRHVGRSSGLPQAAPGVGILRIGSTVPTKPQRRDPHHEQWVCRSTILCPSRLRHSNGKTVGGGALQ